MNNKPLFFKSVNWLGLYTFYCKEVKRFLSIPAQTIIAPMITSLLFLLIFQLSIGRARIQIDGLDFITFLAPGLIMMKIIQNTFSSTSSAIVSGKMLGAIADVLTPPLTNMEIIVGFMGSAITRGMVVATASAIAMFPFVDMNVHSWGLLIFFALFGAMLMGAMGIVAGLWADKWDHMGTVSNYLIMPMSFLSGTFYSISQLPESIKFFTLFNPFFYLVDGFRYAMTGYSDIDPMIGVYVVSAMVVAMWLLVNYLFNIGWKIKS